MYKYVKRFFDIVFSIISIIFLLPFFIPLAILLAVTGEHEVFYLQKRVGYKNGFFKIWKFATMKKNSPNMGLGSITLRNDPRVTKVGKYLRKSKINELPQILNILIGNMSFVGPRPLMKVDFDKFSPDVQDSFYNSKPGITGLASIVFRDEEKFRSETTIDPHEFDKKYIAPYKGELELWYQKNLSFYTDFMLIFLTVLIILRPKSNLIYRIFKDLPKKPKALR